MENIGSPFRQGKFFPFPVCFTLLVISQIFQSCHDEENSIVKVHSHITQFPDNKVAALSLTFDDGCPSVFSKVVPLLEQYNLHGSFYIISGNVEDNGQWSMWNDLIQRGHEVGNHTLTHSYYLGTITDQSVIDREIDSSYNLLRARLIKPPFAFGLPFHSTSPQVDRTIFRKHFASKESPPGFCHMIPLYKTDRFAQELRRAVKEHRWVVTTAHGIEDCYAPMSYSVLKESLDIAISKKDSIYIDTFENLAKYKLESRATKIRTHEDKNGRYFFKLTTNLPMIFDMPLTVSVSGLDPNHYSISSEDSIYNYTTAHGKIFVTLKPRSTFVLTRK